MLMKTGTRCDGSYYLVMCNASNCDYPLPALNSPAHSAKLGVVGRKGERSAHRLFCDETR